MPDCLYLQRVIDLCGLSSDRGKLWFCPFPAVKFVCPILSCDDACKMRLSSWKPKKPYSSGWCLMNLYPAFFIFMVRKKKLLLHGNKVVGSLQSHTWMTIAWVKDSGLAIPHSNIVFLINEQTSKNINQDTFQISVGWFIRETFYRKIEKVKCKPHMQCNDTNPFDR